MAQLVDELRAEKKQLYDVNRTRVRQQSWLLSAEKQFKENYVSVAHSRRRRVVACFLKNKTRDLKTPNLAAPTKLIFGPIWQGCKGC